MPTEPPTRCGICGKSYISVRGRGRGSRRGCPNCSGWAGKRKNEGARIGWGRIYASPMLRVQWRQLRKRYLETHSRCEWCGERPATDVDHKDGTDYRDDSGKSFSWLNPRMCRALCDMCHKKRTGRQGGRS